jgi:hypothetical protein
MILMLLMIASCLLSRSVTADSTDDASGYQSFTDVAAMPSRKSDMTTTDFPGHFFPNNLGRIYLVGGCVQNQLCNVSATAYNCTCPQITAQCLYFTPALNQWSACASAPLARYRHMAARVGDLLYVAGGRWLDDGNGSVPQIDVYNPLTDVWTTPFQWANATSNGKDIQLTSHPCIYHTIFIALIYCGRIMLADCLC